MAIITGVETLVATMVLSDPSGQPAVDIVNEFITYLRGTWMPYPLWHSWVRRGRMDAAQKMGVSVDFILPTTNHLESFNGSLKRKYIPQWQHSGHRLRLDVLVICLSLDIMPRVYARQRVMAQFDEWKKKRFAGLGGVIKSKGGDDGHRFQPLAWYEVDDRRDHDAHHLYQLQYLHAIPSRRPYELWATCHSLGNIPGQLTLSYWLTIHPSGSATCSCLDWLRRGGACKHLRAFRLLIEAWGRRGELQVPFIFPASRQEAEAIAQQNEIWYGSQYNCAVTRPCQETEIVQHANKDEMPPHMMGCLDHHTDGVQSDQGVSSFLGILPPTAVPDELLSLEHFADFEHGVAKCEALETVTEVPKSAFTF